jgi:hypothetical protein
VPAAPRCGRPLRGAAAAVPWVPSQQAQLEPGSSCPYVVRHGSDDTAGAAGCRIHQFSIFHTNLWTVFVPLWAIFVRPPWFALELGLERPPDLLANGRLLPHA